MMAHQWKWPNRIYQSRVCRTRMPPVRLAASLGTVSKAIHVPIGLALFGNPT